MILATLWLLIHKYEISEISEEGFEWLVGVTDHLLSALTAKDGLLLWCMNRTAGYENVRVDNYHRRFFSSFCPQLTQLQI
jgi:hypothetical protein